MNHFSEVVIIGELEFEVSGTYHPEENSNEFCLDFEVVIINLVTDNDTITIDGTTLLDSLECWEKLEEGLIKQLIVSPTCVDDINCGNDDNDNDNDDDDGDYDL